MSQVNWLELFGWGDAQIEDLRFVGYSYIKQGKYDIALHFFEALTVLDPHSLYDLQTLGGLYLETGNHIAALSHLEKALEKEPEHGATRINQVKALLGMNYKPQALSKAKELLTHPDQEIASEAEALVIAYK